MTAFYGLSSLERRDRMLPEAEDGPGAWKDSSQNFSTKKKKGSVLWGVCLRSGRSLKRESTGHWGKGHLWDAWELLSRVKSSNTWSNRQIWPWSTKWSRAKANRVLPRDRTGHSIHPLPTTQENPTYGHHQMVNTKIKLVIFFAAKDGEALYSQQRQRPGADCDSDHELLIAKLNWRK